MASCSAVSTDELIYLGPMRASATVSRLRHFWTVVALMPCRRVRPLTLASLRCMARRIASVGVALPWRVWPIARLSLTVGVVCHHTLGLNT